MTIQPGEVLDSLIPEFDTSRRPFSWIGRREECRDTGGSHCCVSDHHDLATPLGSEAKDG
jgi:hypothetical protein